LPGERHLLLLQKPVEVTKYPKFRIPGNQGIEQMLNIRNHRWLEFPSVNRYLHHATY